MENLEILCIKNEIGEIKQTVKNVEEIVNDMRVLIAGNYITKHDFEEYQRGEKSFRRWFAGFVITAVGVFTAVLNVWLNN